MKAKADLPEHVGTNEGLCTTWAPPNFEQILQWLEQRVRKTAPRKPSPAFAFVWLQVFRLAGKTSRGDEYSEVVLVHVFEYIIGVRTKFY